ncbi:MAG: glycosyltransferase [Marinomonas foliarum]|uniref:glycosyltransferase n=1 Tax=Marinomonas foliarum TaxID=491950 RepID=UPI003F9C41C8
MKVSLVVAVYKDIEALSLIVESLKTQTYKNFELIVAEDNNGEKIREFVSKIKDIEVIHTSQEDNGIRKSRSQNNAILAATGEYIIFIDGDCIPYSTFIESHALLAKQGLALAGRRVNLGPEYSTKIRTGKISALELERSYVLKLPSLWKDCSEGHIEAGIFLKPHNAVFQKWIFPRSSSIVGCNFSCFKSDLIAINGFDESYGETSLPDDTDIEWRLKALGLQVKSCKFAANQFHLYHTRSSRDYSGSQYENDMLARKSKGMFKAQLGLDTHN